MIHTEGVTATPSMAPGIDPWPLLMRYETEYSLPLELPFFHGCPEWSAARSVIDLGSGTGEYLLRLAAHFPGKRYTGVERNPRYVDLARRQLAVAPVPPLTEIALVTGDLFDVAGSWDVVLARHLLEHVPDVDAFLAHVRSILAPGGALIVVDRNDAVRRFVPDPPALMHLFERLREARRAAGGDRDAALRLAARAREAGLELVRCANLVVPSTLPGARDLLVGAAQATFDLARQELGLDVDDALLRQELRAWRSSPGAYAQIGVHLACYRRRC